LLDWSYLYRRIDDKQFSLEDYKPLEAIYRDEHPRQVIRKPGQKGLSVLAISKACHVLDVGARYFGLDKAGLNVGYVFSTKDALSYFSRERFSELRAETPHLANLFTHYDSVTFKQAGKSYLYFAGGRSVSGVKSFAADLLVLDEYEEISKKIVSLTRIRLNNSELQHELLLSTPKLPNVGIDAAYQESDQKVWEVLCSRCGEHNELDFFRDVRAGGEARDVWETWDKERLWEAEMHVACPNCKEPIDSKGPGRWTARRPEIKSVSGYYAPPLSLGKVDLNRLAVKSISTEPEELDEFYRSDLGLPYSQKDSMVTETMLRMLSAELDQGRLPAFKWRNVTMGVDVGAKYNYRVSATGPDSKRYVVAMGVVGSWAELDRLMEVHHVRRCVVDALPELNGCKDWTLKHRGKVFRAFYPHGVEALRTKMFQVPSEAKEEKAKRSKANEADKQDAYTIIINRTMAMDTVYNLIASGGERWPASIHNDADVKRQMCAPVRVLVKDDYGQEHARWDHTTPDHYFHSCVYDVVAFRSMPKEIRGALVTGSAKVRMPE
jgi:hypothetical protein